MSKARAVLLKALRTEAPKASKVPRPSSAYILFGNDARKTSAINALPAKDRMAAIAQKWNATDEATKAKYVAEAAKLKAAMPAAPPPPPAPTSAFPATAAFKDEEAFDTLVSKVSAAATLDFLKALAATGAGETKVLGAGTLNATVDDKGKMTLTWKPPKTFA